MRGAARKSPRWPMRRSSGKSATWRFALHAPGSRLRLLQSPLLALSLGARPVRRVLRLRLLAALQCRRQLPLPGTHLRRLSLQQRLARLARHWKVLSPLLHALDVWHVVQRRAQKRPRRQTTLRRPPRTWRSNAPVARAPVLVSSLLYVHDPSRQPALLAPCRARAFRVLPAAACQLP